MTPSHLLQRPDACLLVLLFTGHMLAEYLFDPRFPTKQRTPKILRHAIILLSTHLILAAPFLLHDQEGFWRGLTLLALLVCFHSFVDYLVECRPNKATSTTFILDLSLHSLTVLGIWRVWQGWLPRSLDVPVGLEPAHLAALSAGSILASAYVLNINGAATVIERALTRFSMPGKKSNEQSQRMGRTIGILERMFVLSLVILGQWQVVGWVFAGKTVARFRELDDREFSEYYLIGTLSSLLFASVTGTAVRLLLFGTL